jgi:hypothetical protein
MHDFDPAKTTWETVSLPRQQRQRAEVDPAAAILEGRGFLPGGATAHEPLRRLVDQRLEM